MESVEVEVEVVAAEDGGVPKATQQKPKDGEVGITLRYYGVGYVTPRLRVLLEGVSGSLEPGDCHAVMGGSGAGKTTLLDVLAHRKRAGSPLGTVLYGGVPWSDGLRRAVGYTEQTSALMPNMTVREMLVMSADLVHGAQGKCAEELGEIVTFILSKLGLTGCADTLIGSPLERGISGGQCRRVDVAVQLLKRPKVLFLDEPTSGLDYSTAKGLVRLIRSLARDTRTPIMATIHQPPADVFAMFDACTLLFDGRAACCAPVHALQRHFADIGCPMPPDSSVAEHAVDSSRALAAAWSTSQVGKEHVARMASTSFASVAASRQSAGSVRGRSGGDGPAPLPFLSALRILLRHRMGPCHRDKKGFLIPRLLSRMVLSLVVASIWNDLPRNGSGMSSRFGMIGAICVSFSIHTAIFVPAIIEDRALFLREYNDGLYPLTAYCAAKMLIEVPACAAGIVFFTTLTYWAAGFQPSLHLYLMYVLTVFVFAMGSIAWTHAVVAGVSRTDVGTALTVGTHVLFNLFSGFLVPNTDIPVWWKWMYHISPTQWAFSTLLDIEFRGQPYTICTAWVSGVDEECIELDALAELKARGYDVAHADRALGVGVLAAYFVLFVCLAYLQLRRRFGGSVYSQA